MSYLNDVKQKIRGYFKIRGLYKYGIGYLVDTSQGLFVVDPRDQIISRFLLKNGDYGSSTVRFLSRFIAENDHIIFIGPHIGTLLVPLAKIAGSVTAYEADPINFRLLRYNVKINSLQNVAAYNLAVGDKDDIIVSIAHDVLNSGHSSIKIESKPTEPRVPMITVTLQPTWEFAQHKVYSPNAVWVKNFNLHGHTLNEMRDPAFYEYDVSFLGNMDGVRYKEHAERQRFFADLSQRMEGLGLRHYIRHSSGISEEEQIRVIQRSRINLSYRSSCDHDGELSWGLPERCYGVPARGGFLLTDQRRHADDDFDAAKECAMFTDIDDCVAKVQYWLANFEASRAVAEAAYAHVMREHTYEDRARNIITVAQQFRDGWI
ncbi:hypothetical protein CCP3SC5AM1_2340002 [Gammaproteobacteria bacterium]